LHKIGIVVVHYGDRRKTEICLASLPKDVDVVVIDNDKDNIGYGAACNKGFKELLDKHNYERIVFLNNDTLVDESFVNKMSGVDCEFVCPQVRGINGDILYNGGWIEKSGPHHITNYVGVDPVKTDFLYGCCIMVKPRAFKTCGGFDEKLFMYWEDVKLSFAAKEMGFGMMVAQNAIVYHDKTAHKKDEDSPVARYYSVRNYPKVMGFTPYYLVYVLKRLVWFAYKLKTKTVWAIIRGFIDGIIGKEGKQ
jgi:GT2 family glycosyltransferase